MLGSQGGAAFQSMMYALYTKGRAAAEVLEVVTLPAEGPDGAPVRPVDEDDVAYRPPGHEVVASY